MTAEHKHEGDLLAFLRTGLDRQNSHGSLHGTFRIIRPKKEIIWTGNSKPLHTRVV